MEERAILGLPSQSAHPPSLYAGAPGCLADNILGISDAVYRVNASYVCYFKGGLTENNTITISAIVYNYFSDIL